MDKKKKTVYAWAMYDWANSAFATVILATVLPIFYKDVAGVNLPGNLATSYWGYTQTIAMIIIAVISPILGAAADPEGPARQLPPPAGVPKVRPGRKREGCSGARRHAL